MENMEQTQGMSEEEKKLADLEAAAEAARRAGVYDPTEAEKGNPN